LVPETQVEHEAGLVPDLDRVSCHSGFLLDSGLFLVGGHGPVGGAQAGKGRIGWLQLPTGERLAVVLGMSAPEEVSHAQAPFAYGFAGKPQKDAQTYMQHLALRTTDIEKLKSYLESKGAEFLTPIYKDKDSFGPLLQSFT